MANHTLDDGVVHTFYARSGLVSLAVSAITTQKYFGVALLTILVYHAFLTMDKEVKYFWHNPYSPVSMIYFVNRCAGLLGQISFIVFNAFKVNLSICWMSLWATSICNLIVVVLIDYILQLRVLAFYHQSKKLSICLKVLLAIEVCIDFGILIADNLSQVYLIGHLTENITFCGQYKNFPRVLDVISWVVPLIYGAILLCLTLFKSAEYWRISHGFKGSRLVKVIVRDQLLYYFFVIFCCVLQIVVVLKATDISLFASDLISAVGNPTLLCLLGSHLLINLKEAGELGVNEGTNYRTNSVSNIEFAGDTLAQTSDSEDTYIA